MASSSGSRIRNVTAVLGPTNTGKTHLAIERMLGHESGVIGLPLRLLAREVYDKLCARAGKDAVALVTGEEKIKPERARYWVSTVEAMPRDLEVEFLAIDEVQLAADPERGHTFTDRLLHARGAHETLLLGAQTMREAIQDLIPDANFISRPRLSKLTYSGEKKITRLPTRTAVVAFSANDVYSYAELIRRQRGGAAVVLGALSPRTRNAQVALYQNGDVDFLVATDAIGMGLNLDVDHVAFASVRKFDGVSHRKLLPAELAQIAGRAGRHLNDGTFGVTADVEPFDAELIEQLETHTFPPVKLLQWRNRSLDFSSLAALRRSLDEVPGNPRLVRARIGDDLEALDQVSRDEDIRRLASAPAAVAKLWDVCQVPDYRKISSTSHAELIASLYKSLMGPEERIDEDWFAQQVDHSNRTDGDIDTLAQRLAHIRTWTFVANRADWLKDPAHWQERTREVEDRLSDALHVCLTQRFVDQRTSALMKGMREKESLTTEIGNDGSVNVENHYVGRLEGLRFFPDTKVEGMEGRATRNAASQVLQQEMSMRVRRMVAAKDDAYALTPSGRITWRDEVVGRLVPGDDYLKPSVELIADNDYLSPADRERLQERVATWVSSQIGEKLKPLVDMAKAEDISGLARGIAFRIAEGFGALQREQAAEELKTLDQPARAQLRRHGVRFGAFNVFVPMLLKPAPAKFIAALWALKHAGEHGLDIENLPEPPRAGLTSVPREESIPEPFYRAHGFQVCGPRVVRFDMLERLSDQIRPLVAWRRKDSRPVPAEQAGSTNGEQAAAGSDTAVASAAGAGDNPPKGATGDGGFTITPEMMSILGCSATELGEVLKSLGFRLERKRKPKESPEAADPGSANGVDVTAEDAGAPATDQAAEAEAAPDTQVSVEMAGAGEANAQQSGGEAKAEQSEGADDATAEATGAPASDADAAGALRLTAGDESGSGTEAAAETLTGAEVVKATETEDDFIEIWRPRRHPRGQRRRSRPGRAGHGGAPDAHSGRASGSDGAGGPGRGTEAGPGEGRKGRRGRGAGKAGLPGAANRGPGKPHTDGAPGAGRSAHGRGGKGRGGKGDKDGRKRSLVHSSGPRKSKSADADSPFAALNALKQAMTEKGDGSKS